MIEKGLIEDMFRNAREVIQFINKYNIVSIDLKTCDLFGRWRHLTTPARYITEAVLAEGFGFDGSSYGFKKVDRSDMILIPDLTTGVVDPFWDQPTLSFTCNIHVVEGDEPRFEQDPRFVLSKAEKALYSLKIGDKLLLGPEYEFYVFDGISFDDRMEGAFFEVNSRQAHWSAHDPDGPMGYPMPLKGGYHGGQPEDTFASFRTDLVETLSRMQVGVKYHHHEVGGPGQMEIETEFGGPTEMADKTMLIKYATKNLAKKIGKTATFMPKPMFGAPGNGFHVHFKLMKGKTNMFADAKGYSGMSKTALHFMSGILAHARAISAFANPCTNSYKRLVPGYEAPVSVVFACSNRSAAIRIPGYVKEADDKRFEYRAGDAAANPYLMFAALVMAGVDGIKRKMDPKKEGFGPFDGNLYELPPSEQKKIGHLPRNLMESLDALSADHKFLLEGGVFTKELIETWIKRKTDEDLMPIMLRPHPYEYFLTFGC